jgi:thioredoxin-dependent peroxiredoxin
VKIRPFFITMAFLSLFGCSLGAEPLAIGANAPDITAPDENGRPVDFAKVYAHGLTLVYFYPKADTPGCTAQACSLRDGIADLKTDGVTILGVSHDTAEAQKKFKEKYRLPFTLIADHDGKVIQAFGVPTIIFGIAKRQSFLIKDGKVVWRSLSAETKGHAEEVRKAVAALKG